MSRGYHRRLARSVGVNEVAREQSFHEEETPKGDTSISMPPSPPDSDGSFSEVQESFKTIENPQLP